MEPVPTVSALKSYGEALEALAANDLGADRGAKRHNRLVHDLQRAHLVLRQTHEGRVAITTFMNDPRPEVAAWAAAHSLQWDPDAAKTRLTEISRGPGLVAVDAKWTLRSFDAGKLSLDWVPPA